jgi:predicted Fe-S protein YdhL (DUF1289 family)
MITPCLQQCRVDPITKVCQGCQRTLDEIANWIYFTDIQRQAIMERLLTRK